MIIITCSKTTKHVIKIFLLWSKSYFLPLFKNNFWIHRSSSPEVFLGKRVLKICSKFTGEQTCRSAISIKLAASEFREIWETFHVVLRNLTPLICKEINLFIILIIKWFIERKKHTWSSNCLMRNYYTSIYQLELTKSLSFLRAKNNKITCSKLLIITRVLL